MQQRLVREAFESAKRPLRPEEAWQRAQRNRPGLGMATVYRTIKSLLDTQELCAVELPGEATLYEMNHGHHHHHFHCRTCRQVFEVESCPVHAEEIAIPGFTIERHEITLYGLCRDCAPNKKISGRKRK